jgi:tripartite ATP-independent transporter DctM subunit
MYKGAWGPSILQVLIFLIYTFVLSKVAPGHVPGLPATARTLHGWTLWKKCLRGIIPSAILIFAVLGSMGGLPGMSYAIATPTEAGAMGAVGAIGLAAINKRLSWTLVRQAMESTMRITAMVIFILIGSTVFSLVFQGVDGGIWIEHMLTSMTGGDPRTFLIIVNIFVFFLAFFLDFFEIAFIIIPLLAPVAAKLGIDLVWFGVLLCVNMQTSFMHPPFGFALFYLRGIAPKEIKSSDIYLGAIPWVVMQLLLVAILIFWPGMVTNFLDKPVKINTENIQMDIKSEEPAGSSSEKSEPNNDPFSIKKD